MSSGLVVVEEAFLLIKPDAATHHQEVLAVLREAGLQVKMKSLRGLSRLQAEAVVAQYPHIQQMFYAEHIARLERDGELVGGRGTFMRAAGGGGGAGGPQSAAAFAPPSSFSCEQQQVGQQNGHTQQQRGLSFSSSRSPRLGDPSQPTGPTASFYRQQSVRGALNTSANNGGGGGGSFYPSSSSRGGGAGRSSASRLGGKDVSQQILKLVKNETKQQQNNGGSSPMTNNNHSQAMIPRPPNASLSSPQQRYGRVGGGLGGGAFASTSGAIPSMLKSAGLDFNELRGADDTDAVPFSTTNLANNTRSMMVAQQHNYGSNSPRRMMLGTIGHNVGNNNDMSTMTVAGGGYGGGGMGGTGFPSTTSGVGGGGDGRMSALDTSYSMTYYYSNGAGGNPNDNGEGAQPFLANWLHSPARKQYQQQQQQQQQQYNSVSGYSSPQPLASFSPMDGFGSVNTSHLYNSSAQSLHGHSVVPPLGWGGGGGHQQSPRGNATAAAATAALLPHLQGAVVSTAPPSADAREFQPRKPSPALEKGRQHGKWSPAEDAYEASIDYLVAGGTCLALVVAGERAVTRLHELVSGGGGATHCWTKGECIHYAPHSLRARFAGGPLSDKMYNGFHCSADFNDSAALIQSVFGYETELKSEIMSATAYAASKNGNGGSRRGSRLLPSLGDHGVSARVMAASEVTESSRPLLAILDGDDRTKAITALVARFNKETAQLKVAGGKPLRPEYAKALEGGGEDADGNAHPRKGARGSHGDGEGGSSSSSASDDDYSSSSGDNDDDNHDASAGMCSRTTGAPLHGPGVRRGTATPSVAGTADTMTRAWQQLGKHASSSARPHPPTNNISSTAVNISSTAVTSRRNSNSILRSAATVDLLSPRSPILSAGGMGSAAHSPRTPSISGRTFETTLNSTAKSPASAARDTTRSAHNSTSKHHHRGDKTSKTDGTGIRNDIGGGNSNSYSNREAADFRAKAADLEAREHALQRQQGVINQIVQILSNERQAMQQEARRLRVNELQVMLRERRLEEGVAKQDAVMGELYQQVISEHVQRSEALAEQQREFEQQLMYQSESRRSITQQPASYHQQHQQ